MANEAVAKPNTEAKNIVQVTRDLLNGNRKQLEDALGELQRFVTPEKLIRVVMTTMQEDWKLLKCEPKTIFASAIQLAQVGLVPDGFLGQAYLVPFKDGFQSKKQGRDVYNATPMIGYKGFGELIARSGKANSHDANVVYANDKFDFEKGSTPFITHKQALSNRGEMIGAYAIVYMKEGPVRFEIMGKEEVEKVMTEAAKGADDKDSPWKKWPEAMWRKTPMRRLASWLALSPEFQRAGSLDELSDLGRMKLVDVPGGGAVWVPADKHPEPTTIQQVRRAEPITVVGNPQPGEAAKELPKGEQKPEQSKTGTATPPSGDKDMCGAGSEEFGWCLKKPHGADVPHVFESNFGDEGEPGQQAAESTQEAPKGESREEFERDRMGQTGEENARKAQAESQPPKPQHQAGSDVPAGYDPNGKHISMNRVNRLFAIARAAAAGEGKPPFDEAEFKRWVCKAYNIADIRLFPNDKKLYDKLCTGIGGSKLKLK